MTGRRASDPALDPSIHAWLELGPTELADRVIERSRADIEVTRQRRAEGWLSGIRTRQPARLAWILAAAAVVLVLVAVGVSVVSGPLVGSHASQSTTPTSVIAGALPKGGEPLFPGTYTSPFTPAFTFTVGDVVGLDCATGFTCRGAVDANQPGWIDMEFGTQRGAEIMFLRLDQVLDPSSPTNVIPPPEDLSAWLTALEAANRSHYHSVPGFAEFEPAKSIVIGGLPALQFDLKTPGNIQFGPMADDPTSQAGIGPNAVRVVFVTVHGHLVLITEWLAAGNTVLDRPAALESLRPLLESVTWQ
jgi:hypothetical protein